MNRVTALIVGALLVIAGCDGGASTSTTANIGPASTTTQQSSDSASTTVDSNTDTTTTTSGAAPDDPVIAGIDSIEQTTATSGGGIRPLLEWSPVDGAATYIVMVYTESGESYWSAYTSESSTYVGGPLQIPEGRTGPNVADGYTWSVYAEDAAGVLLAASPLRSISP